MMRWVISRKKIRFNDQTKAKFGKVFHGLMLIRYKLKVGDFCIVFNSPEVADDVTEDYRDT
jgi:hypothetical protein